MCCHCSFLKLIPCRSVPLGLMALSLLPLQVHCELHDLTGKNCQCKGFLLQYTCQCPVTDTVQYVSKITYLCWFFVCTCINIYFHFVCTYLFRHFSVHCTLHNCQTYWSSVLHRTASCRTYSNL